MASVCAVLALVGCGGNQKETTTAGVTETDRQTTAEQGKIGGELNLFTWDGMFPQEVLDEFVGEINDIHKVKI